MYLPVWPTPICCVTANARTYRAVCHHPPLCEARVCPPPPPARARALLVSVAGPRPPHRALLRLCCCGVCACLLIPLDRCRDNRRFSVSSSGGAKHPPPSPAAAAAAVAAAAAAAGQEVIEGSYARSSISAAGSAAPVAQAAAPARASCGGAARALEYGHNNNK